MALPGVIKARAALRDYEENLDISDRALTNLIIRLADECKVGPFTTRGLTVEESLLLAGTIQTRVAWQAKVERQRETVLFMEET